MISKYNEKESFDYENGFYLTSEPYRMGNIISHYELYKMILNIPGDVIELGVFKGGSIIQFATFRELLENERSRKIIGFDIFGEFPPDNGKVQSDTRFINNWNAIFAGGGLSDEDLYRSLKLKAIQNVELVKGNICDTLPRYIEENPQLKLAVLHIDTDVYTPSKIGLESLFDKVVKGGIIIFDDYGTVEGETLAVDEFFGDKKYILRKFSFSHNKPSYIIKQ